MKYSGMIKPEIDRVLSLAHFTKDEQEIFLELTKGKSIVEIAMKMGYSSATVIRRIADIKKKVVRID